MEKHKKKAHHYISRLILQNFSFDGKAIYVYNHHQHKTYPQSIYKAFTENNLNTLIDEEGNKYHNDVEDFYDINFERNVAPVIKKIQNNINGKVPFKKISIDEYTELLKFTILNEVRTPASFSKTNNGLAKGVQAAWMIDFYLKNKHLNTNIHFGMRNNNTNIHTILNKITDMIKMCVDLKLRILYHKEPDEYFLLPDKGVVIQASGFKFAAQDLQLYFPISNNIVLLFERVENNYPPIIDQQFNKQQVHDLNLFLANNSFDFIGCSNKEYLECFISRHRREITPKKKYSTLVEEHDFEQIKSEIQQKLVGKEWNFASIITHIDEDNDFRIYTRFRKDADGGITLFPDLN